MLDDMPRQSTAIATNSGSEVVTPQRGGLPGLLWMAGIRTALSRLLLPIQMKGKDSR